MSATHLLTAVTLLILKTAIFVAGQNVTFTNTTTIITTVLTSTISNRTNCTMPPPPPPPSNMTPATTQTTTSSRVTTPSSVSSTRGPLIYCWFPCFGGSCGGYSLPQNTSSGGRFSWWFGFQFQWPRSKPWQGSPCPNGGRYRRRKGC